MFGLVDIILFCLIMSIVTSLVCFSGIGSIIQNRENEAYKKGYYKGYEDGKKVGGANDILR